jgi:hypothetical protein
MWRWLVDASRWLNRRTTTRDRHMTVSAKSHALALEGRWFGYRRCLLIDAAWLPFERAHCRRAWEYWRALGDA